MASFELSAEDKAKLYDESPLCNVVLDSGGIARSGNAAFVDHMGELFKFQNLPFSHTAADDDGKAVLQAAIDAVASGRSSRERVRDLNMLALGSGMPLKRRFDWIVGARGGGVSGVVLHGDPCSDDVVAQRTKDAELIDFFQNAPIALHWLGGDGIVMWANQTELDTLGYSAEEYIGQPIMKFCPDEEELVLEIFKQLGSGNIIKDVPVRFRTKAGKIVPLLIDSNVNYHPDGSFHHTRCFIRDDTGRRVREARAAALLKETKRSLQLLDAFVSRTLHLVRTPCHVITQSLGILSSNLQELAARMPASEAKGFAESETLLQSSMSQLTDVAALINDASDVMRFEQGAVLQCVPVPMPIKMLGRAAIDAAAALCKPGVTCAFVFEAGSGSITIDSRVLHRTLDHLLRNAAAATPSGGAIALSVSHERKPVAAKPRAAATAGAEGAVAEGGKLPPPSGAAAGSSRLAAASANAQTNFGSWGGDRSQASEQRVVFSVSDNGCGLATTEGLFQRYAPGASPPITPEMGAREIEDAIEKSRRGLGSSLQMEAEKGNGLGIGLNLCYGLVNAMGGELLVESRPGATRFWFSLPVGHTCMPFVPPPHGTHEAAESYKVTSEPSEATERRDPRAAARAQKRRNWDSIAGASGGSGSGGESAAEVSESESGSPEQAASRSTTTGATFVEEPPKKKRVVSSSVAQQGLCAMDAPHVLVVEDVMMSAKILRMSLKKMGCSTDHAENGQVAVDMVRDAEPGLYSLILMDLRMPVMDGLEATRIIKTELKVEVPVIALTADDGFDTREKCKEIGFNDFATKPLLVASLKQLLETYTDHKVA